MISPPPSQCYRCSARPLFPEQAGWAGFWSSLLFLSEPAGALPSTAVCFYSLLFDICFTAFRGELVQDQAEALTQASFSTPPLPNYSPHLGFCVGFAVVPTRSEGVSDTCSAFVCECTCTVFVYLESPVTGLWERWDENQGNKGCKIISRGMQETNG